MSYFTKQLDIILEEHEYSCVLLDITGDAANRISKLAETIPEEDLAEDGREENPHITIKFGLHVSDSSDVKGLLQGVSPVKVKFGKTSIFQNDEHDVVKIDVRGKSLFDMNRKISNNIECTDTHSEYKPHVTLAYVKSGCGHKYSGLDDLLGDEITFDKVKFSDKDKNKTTIKLSESIVAEGDQYDDLMGSKPLPDQDEYGDICDICKQRIGGEWSIIAQCLCRFCEQCWEKNIDRHETIHCPEHGHYPPIDPPNIMWGNIREDEYDDLMGSKPLPDQDEYGGPEHEATEFVEWLNHTAVPYITNDNLRFILLWDQHGNQVQSDVTSKVQNHKYFVQAEWKRANEDELSYDPGTLLVYITTGLQDDEWEYLACYDDTDAAWHVVGMPHSG